MATQSRAPGAVIGLLGIASVCLVLFFMLKSGMSLPYGLQNPFHKSAEEWRSATPDETKAATDLIDKQLEAFRQRDIATVAGFMSVRADPAMRQTSNLGMMNYRMLRIGPSTPPPVYGPVHADKATGELLVTITIGQAGSQKDLEYRLVKEGGEYRILSFHYPDSEFAKAKSSG
jgi:hypothetical protein